MAEAKYYHPDPDLPDLDTRPHTGKLRDCADTRCQQKFRELYGTMPHGSSAMDYKTEAVPSPVESQVRELAEEFKRSMGQLSRNISELRADMIRFSQPSNANGVKLARLIDQVGELSERVTALEPDTRPAPAIAWHNPYGPWDKLADVPVHIRTVISSAREVLRRNMDVRPEYREHNITHTNSGEPIWVDTYSGRLIGDAAGPFRLASVNYDALPGAVPYPSQWETLEQIADDVNEVLTRTGRGAYRTTGGWWNYRDTITRVTDTAGPFRPVGGAPWKR